MRNQKLQIIITFITCIFLMACSKLAKEDQGSKINEESISVNTGQIGGVNTSVGTDINSLLFFLTSDFWWSNNGKPDKPECGQAVTGTCAGKMTEEKARNCQELYTRVQEINPENGFYYVEVNHADWCKQRCRRKMPNCSGLGCIGSAITYANKKFLEATTLCQKGCREAIAQRSAFPLECRNINDDPERKRLIELAKTNATALQNDPEYKALLEKQAAQKAQLAAYTAHEKILDEAEKELETYMKTYADTMPKLVRNYRDADQVLREKLISLANTVTMHQSQIVKARDLILISNPSETQVNEALEILNKQKEGVCTISFSFTENVSAIIQAKEDIAKTNLVFLEKIKATENQSLLQEYTIKTEKMLSNLVSVEIPQEIKNRSLLNDTCNSYRKVFLGASLRRFLVNRQTTSEDISEIIKKIAGSFNNDELFREKLTLKKELISHATSMLSELENARAKLQLVRGNELAVEITKALYLLFYPAIDMCNAMTAEEKSTFKQELKAVITKPVASWNTNVASQTPEKIVSARIYSQNQRLKILKNLMNKKLLAGASYESEWQKVTEGFVDILDKDRTKINFSQEFDMARLLEVDREINKFEPVLNRFINNLRDN